METAAALARKPKMMTYVLSPVLRAYRLDVPEQIEVGSQGSARLWRFGVIPAWTHHITIKQLDPTEIYTNEDGGPVHTWNHGLTFAPIDDHRCRYTDEIETDDRLRGGPTRLFIKLMFRHRHRRWRTITLPAIASHLCGARIRPTAAEPRDLTKSSSLLISVTKIFTHLPLVPLGSLKSNPIASMRIGRCGVFASWPGSPFCSDVKSGVAALR